MREINLKIAPEGIGECEISISCTDSNYTSIPITIPVGVAEPTETCEIELFSSPDKNRMVILESFDNIIHPSCTDIDLFQRDTSCEIISSITDVDLFQRDKQCDILTSCSSIDLFMKEPDIPVIIPSCSDIYLEVAES